MSLTNYYSIMGLQTEEPYGAHFIPGGLQGSSAGCAKPVRGAEEEEGTGGSHIPDFSHFSSKQTSLNSFASWTNTSTSSSPSPSPQLQSTPGLFHPHHLLNHHHHSHSHHHRHHPYYGPQTQSHAEHLASTTASESRFVRGWEGTAPVSEASLSGFPACVPAQGDLSSVSPRFEAVKPEHSPPSHGSPGDSSFDSPSEVVLERLGTVEELGGKPEPKTEDEERKTQHDPGKDRWTKLRNVY